MIEAFVAVLLLWLFAIWNKNDWHNMFIKFVLLMAGLALAFEAMRAFGYIVNT